MANSKLEHVEDFAAIADLELAIIDQHAELRALKQQDGAPGGYALP